MELRARPFVGTFVAWGVLIAGVILRANAHALTWPQMYSYSGERANTIWAIQEQVVIDLSYALMGLGVLLIAVLFHHWLSASRAPKS